MPLWAPFIPFRTLIISENVIARFYAMSSKVLEFERIEFDMLRHIFGASSRATNDVHTLRAMGKSQHRALGKTKLASVLAIVSAELQTEMIRLKSQLQPSGCIVLSLHTWLYHVMFRASTLAYYGPILPLEDVWPHFQIFDRDFGALATCAGVNLPMALTTRALCPEGVKWVIQAQDV